MCGKYYKDREFIPKLSTLFKEENVIPDSELRREWENVLIDSGAADVSPTDNAVVIFSSGGQLTASNMEWGLRDPYHNTLVINARAESVFDKKMFADSIRARRCVIPASGYYEWDSAKARYRFTMPDGGLTLLTGIYRLELGEPHYTILTTEANECMKPVHPRMPVTIAQDEIKGWLTDDSAVSDFLARQPEELTRTQDSGQISMNLGI